MAPNPTPPPLMQLRHARALVHVAKYVRTMRALAPNTLVAPSTKTIAAFHHLHPLSEVDLPPFINDFHLKTNLVLDKETFIFTLTHFPHLLSGGPLGMVYELLWDCFDPNDSTSGFDFFLKICGHVALGHVLPSISCLLVTS
jgi:hypothetical protein